MKEPAQDPGAVAERALSLLERLVAFDTTSRDSNLPLIEFVEAELGRLGVACRRIPSPDGVKAGLFASVGPAVEGGVVLSGHTDVVPVDGQSWTSDPFRLTRRGDRLYGRGTCDMKGFIALALAAAPGFASAGLKRPVHLALSYDEEVGCLGAPDLIRALSEALPAPSAVIVGEPTGMEAVRGHKGISTYRVKVTGREAHSSLTHLGVSANMAAVGLMHRLVQISENLVRGADADSGFQPPGATLTIGQIGGGSAINILARECVFGFDLRTPPGMDPEAILAPFYLAVDELDRDLRARFPEAGARIERRSATPPLAPESDGAAERLARRLAGDNGPPRLVPYAAEAGQFQAAGFSTVICGPGSIDQAHQPDEYLEMAQIERGAAFMVRLGEALSA